MPRESARRQSIKKKAVPIAGKLHPGIADLDPVAFVAAFPFERVVGAFPPEGVGVVGWWFSSHAKALTRLEAHGKILRWTDHKFLRPFIPVVPFP